MLSREMSKTVTEKSRYVSTLGTLQEGYIVEIGRKKMRVKAGDGKQSAGGEETTLASTIC